jgi:hypothetical protein
LRTKNKLNAFAHQEQAPGQPVAIITLLALMTA